SFVLAFYTAVEAAAFALEIQLVLLQLNWPQELLDHELCAVVRQAPLYSDSNEGATPAGAGQSASNEGGGGGGGGGMHSSNGGLEDVIVVPGSSTMGMSTARVLAEYGDSVAPTSVHMEPWGLQAVDEEQAAVLNSDERLMKSLYRATSRRPPGRSRTFSTIQGLRKQQEQSSWSAGLQRHRRQTGTAATSRGGDRRGSGAGGARGAGGGGADAVAAAVAVAAITNPAEAWVAGRSLSDSRSELELQGAISRSQSCLVLGSDSATDTGERDSMLQLQPAPQVPPTGARTGSMSQQLHRHHPQEHLLPRPRQQASASASGLGGGPGGIFRGYHH
ncbi:hypothetical protein Vretimale_9732, partial [Volvox reticuliferus]